MLLHSTLVLLFACQSPLLAQEVSPEVRGLVLNAEGAFEGYTLLAPLTEKVIRMLDMEGEVVKRWEMETLTESLVLLDNGNLLLWGIASVEPNDRFHGPGVDGGLVMEMDWDGNVVWKFVLDDDYQLFHHDIAQLPNGNILILAWEHRYPEDAIAWGRDPAQIGERGMWPDAILELHPPAPEGAAIVWEWHVWDHMVQDFDRSKSNYGSVHDNPGKVDINVDHRGQPAMSRGELQELQELERQMAALGYGGNDGEDQDTPRQGSVPDWMHTNGIDYHPEYDLIVLSSPTLNELWVIDHSTTTEQAAWDSGGRFGKGGDILWRWGNPRNYGMGGDGEQQLFFQHQPTWVSGTKPGELRVLVFNNGRGRPGGAHSSVDELVLPFDPERGFQRTSGEAFGPESPIWSFSSGPDFFSSFISGAQRLPNGNTLVCSGAQGHVFEVTPDQRVVWDYLNPVGGELKVGGSTIPPVSLYRATRVGKDHPGLVGKDL